MKEKSIPYVFNPKRGKNFRKLSKLKRIFTIAFTVSCAFLITMTIFGGQVEDGYLVLYAAIVITALTGIALFVVLRKLKQERR